MSDLPRTNSSSNQQSSQVYHISFRWSVPDDNKSNDDRINDLCVKLFDRYIYQLENTVTDGRNNYHYQGYGHLKDGKSRPSTVKSLAISCNGYTHGIEMSAASTAGITALKEYSMKEETRVRGPWADGSRYLGEDLVPSLWPWQQQVKDYIDGPVHPRTINCIIEKTGNIGKSAFCKYMAFKYDLPVLGWGRTGDLLHLVSKLPNKKAYLFDLARTKPKDWANGDIYSAMEGIKNGLFVNTKYECKQVIMKVPHVWIFTNTSPDLTTMSSDRWVLWEIVDKQLHRLGARRSILRDGNHERRRSCSPTQELIEID